MSFFAHPSEIKFFIRRSIDPAADIERGFSSVGTTVYSRVSEEAALIAAAAEYGIEPDEENPRAFARFCDRTDMRFHPQLGGWVIARRGLCYHAAFDTQAEAMEAARTGEFVAEADACHPGELYVFAGLRTDEVTEDDGRTFLPDGRWWRPATPSHKNRAVKAAIKAVKGVEALDREALDAQRRIELAKLQEKYAPASSAYHAARRELVGGYVSRRRELGGTTFTVCHFLGHELRRRYRQQCPTTASARGYRKLQFKFAQALKALDDAHWEYMRLNYDPEWHAIHDAYAPKFHALHEKYASQLAALRGELSQAEDDDTPALTRVKITVLVEDAE